MEKGDLETVLQMEQELFPDEPWLERNFLYEMNENPYACMIVSEENGNVNGYADLWIMYEQAQLCNIAVNKEEQRKGIGESLLQYCIAKAEQEGCEVMSLEVRVSNEKAISLYTKNGFIKAAVRKGYYGNGEDAWLMIRPLGGSVDDDFAGN